jgi:hypothetical protein
MTNTQNLVCESEALMREIRGIMKWSRSEEYQIEMAVLIGLFAKIAGVTMDCPTLNAMAQQYACVPRQNQLPVLIGLANIMLIGGGPGGGVYAGNYGGFPPPFTPGTPSAIATDTSGNNRQWVWLNGNWN